MPVRATGWARFLPPGFRRPKWEVIGGFRYAVGNLKTPSEVINVPDGFTFDGASVPLLLRLFAPMAHPDYIQAAALHDWMLEHEDCSRWHSDRVFREALEVLGMPPLWCALMHRAVNTATIRWHIRRLFNAGGLHAG
ncbi:DUF1353 domain-containing protein [Phaeobacter sp. JH18-13]|uniref:DUF1353 domain-containing protein n=1 Tax=Phaeobacter sp. JH18-13 TaxID=3112446 RepID=UPI003A87541F